MTWFSGVMVDDGWLMGQAFDGFLVGLMMVDD